MKKIFLVFMSVLLLSSSEALNSKNVTNNTENAKTDRIFTLTMNTTPRTTITVRQSQIQNRVIPDFLAAAEIRIGRGNYRGVKIFRDLLLTPTMSEDAMSSAFYDAFGAQLIDIKVKRVASIFEGIITVQSTTFFKK